PGAAMGADDLLLNGCKVAVIENHNGDSYANTYSDSRNTYYAITGFPTAIFDGLSRVVGGNHSSSMYSSYLPKYNARIAVPSPLAMEINITHTGLNYTAVITMTKVGTITATDLKLQLFVTQSGISQNWQGQTHLEHVNRLMVPDKNGTAIDFTSGNTVTKTLNYTLDAAWPVEDVEFITFVQSTSTKECFNTLKRAAIDLTADFNASATVVPHAGTVHFTSNVAGGYIGTPQHYTWTFPGGTPATDTAANPTVVYNECGIFDVTFSVDRGGQVITITKPMYFTAGTPPSLVITPNDTTCSSQPITLDATTPNATYLWQPGGSTAPTFVVSYPQFPLGVNFFSVNISTPDGCSTTKTILTYLKDCPVGISEKSNDLSASVYPNPSDGNFTVEMNALHNQVVDLKVVNVANTTVYEEKGISVNGKLLKNLNLNTLSSGMYYVILQGDKQRIAQKLFVK
ncbi:MAG: Omp28-related outer membrane protein, partial [Bacteroidota bacterium]